MYCKNRNNVQLQYSMGVHALNSAFLQCNELPLLICKLRMRARVQRQLGIFLFYKELRATRKDEPALLLEGLLKAWSSHAPHHGDFILKASNMPLLTLRACLIGSAFEHLQGPMH